jgi:hypothetical protein
MLLRAALVAACLLVPSAAYADTLDGSVTMVGESGDYVSQGNTFLFDQSGTLDVSGTASKVEIDTPTPPGAVFGYTLVFEAPQGQTLAPGDYPNAQRFPFETGDNAGLSVYGDGRGCNEEFDRFVVKDIHVTAGGVPDRFWATYELHCEQPHRPALTGEVRVGEPAASTPEKVEPRAIAYRNTDVGSASPGIPLTVTAGPSGANIGAVALQGAGAGQFHVDSDGCTGQSLPAAATCQVYVSARPTAAGDQAAQLAVTDTSTDVTTVDLSLQPQSDVTAITPTSGPLSGGTSLTITGRNFTGVTDVKIGGVSATSYTVTSPTRITAITPPGDAGWTGVEIFGAHGHSWASPNGDFDYVMPTTTTLDATPQTSVFGAPVSYTATVDADGGSPFGLVEFSIDGSDVAGVSLSGGKAHDSLVADVGSTVRADYAGGNNYGASFGTVQPDIAPAPTSTTLTSTANPISPFAAFTITAHVANTATGIRPFGSVQFYSNGVPVLDPIELDQNGDAGIIGKQAAGTYAIRADYVDDTADIPDFKPSSGTLSEQVGATPVTTATTPITTTTPTVPTVTGPNNAFFASKPSSNAGAIVLSVQSGDVGALTYVAKTVQKFAQTSRTRKSPVIYARGKAITPGGRKTMRLVIRPNAAAKRLLARKKHLKLSLSLTFQSSRGGSPNHSVVGVTVSSKKAATPRP